MTVVEHPHSATWSFALQESERASGWLTRPQARLLWERARAVADGGTVLEIGSYRGRSTVVLATAARPGTLVIAVDPHATSSADDALRYGGDEDLAAFRETLEHAGVAHRVQHLRMTSAEALSEYTGLVDLAFIDGRHRYPYARDDLRDWSRRVPLGGSVLIHDAYSSVGVTLAVLRVMGPSGRFRFVGRTGSLVEYRREELSGRARVRNAGRHLAQLPWFARNLLVRLALVARLRAVTRLLGHQGSERPI